MTKTIDKKMKKKKKTVSMADRKLAQARNSKNKEQLQKACKTVVEDDMEKKYATSRFECCACVLPSRPEQSKPILHLAHRTP